MIGGDLFQRLFLRFSIGLVIAFLLFLPLVHVFQSRVVSDEWQEDLQQQAHWLALHSRTGENLEMLANAWRTTHSTIRFTAFDTEGQLVVDSQPELPIPDLAALQQGQEPLDYFAAYEEMRGGGWLVISRPAIRAFPQGIQWGLIAAAALIVALVAAFIYPFVRSMSTKLKQMTELADQVSSGHFGKTLEVDRSDELGTLVRALNEMSGKLGEAERLNTRLLHDVSHELRSPLGRIQVMAETIALKPEQADECIKGIDQEVALLDRLVGDLLESARIESGTRSARPELFSLLNWANETLRRLESKVRSSQIDWTTRLPEQDREISGDPQRLAQAVGNLVDNAIIALEGRPGPRIEVSIAIDGDHWSLSVDDNGRGIPEDELPHVFRRFYRVEKHRGREQGGVGLGLSLVRAIAEAHGGEASIESQAKKGTKVTLTIPLERN